MGLHITQAIGQLPTMLPRQIIFVANLYALFYGNQAQTEALRQEVGAIDSYGARLIPILNLLFPQADNLLVLERAPDEVLCQYFQNELGLSLPVVKVIPNDVLRTMFDDTIAQKGSNSLIALQMHKAAFLDGYVTDHDLVSLAQRLGKKTMSSFEGSHRGNNKYLLHEYLLAADLPHFETLVARTSEIVMDRLTQLRRWGYKTAVIKASIGASGIGMMKVALETLKDVVVPEYLFYEGPCLVQGWLDGSVEGITEISSPSVQLLVCDKGFYLYDMTEQILSAQSVHEGNMAPPSFMKIGGPLFREMIRQTSLAGTWLHQQGYRGPASMDFHVVQRYTSVEVRLCEINARVSGATYPSLLARTFMPQGAWVMRNIRFNPPVTTEIILNVLDQAGLLFRPGKPQGVLPINVNPNDTNEIVKGQFLFLGHDSAEASSMLLRMVALPTLQGEYDRD